MPARRADVPASAGLRYVTDDMPGIRRQKRGSGFTYLDPDGHVIRDPASLHRFRALVIPPAWTNVWICPLPEGHLQVTARDARGNSERDPEQGRKDCENQPHSRARFEAIEGWFGFRLLERGSLAPCRGHPLHGVSDRKWHAC